MYTTLLKEKFPVDERLSLYQFPALPAKKLGGILAKETRISSPNAIIGLHLVEGFFSTAYIIFTAKQCFYPGGSFDLSEVRGCQVNNTTCTVLVNQKGNITQHKMEAASNQVALLMQKVFENIQRFDPSAITEATADYSQFEEKAVDWLLLRDEVMRTIDMLFDKFNEGKLSLLEYEEKKQQLLDRL